MVRLDRAHHRPIAGDSALAEAVKVLTRAHQSMIWARQEQVNVLRSTLREFYPGALEAFAGEADGLLGPKAAAVLALAPTPGAGRRLTQAKIKKALRAAGRKRPVWAGSQGFCGHYHLDLWRA